MGMPDKRRKKIETAATIGLLLVAIGLVGPFTRMEDEILIKVFKWIYTAGAVTFLAARLFDVRGAQNESLRLRRLRRMEAWAGIAFAVGAFFWFYNAGKFDEHIWTLGLMRETVLFTLAGALIQIISSWMIVGAMKKENAASFDEGNKK